MQELSCRVSINKWLDFHNDQVPPLLALLCPALLDKQFEALQRGLGVLPVSMAIPPHCKEKGRGLGSAQQDPRPATLWLIAPATSYVADFSRSIGYLQRV
jgi:hypothetical protein